jgi:MOSC domain-containing protein YiiM
MVTPITARVIAVNISARKGVSKENVSQGLLREGHGLVGDAHAGPDTHRQVSLLAMESIDKMGNLGLEVGPGDFAENLTTKGIDVASLPLGTRVAVGGEALLEITQIGKDCHTGCAIYRQIGKCVMPKKGVFAKVIRGGLVKSGDPISVC